jgi:hypothetical protein
MHRHDIACACACCFYNAYERVRRLQIALSLSEVVAF